MRTASRRSHLPAATLLLIAKLTREGLTASSVASELTRRGIPTSTGLTAWRATSVRSVLDSQRGRAALAGRPCSAPTSEPAGPHAAVGHLIWQRRSAAGLTMRQLAGLAGVSTATVERIENGKGAAPSPVTLAAVLSGVGAAPAEVAPLVDDDRLRMTTLRLMATAGRDERELLAHAA